MTDKLAISKINKIVAIAEGKRIGSLEIANNFYTSFSSVFLQPKIAQLAKPIAIIASTKKRNRMGQWKELKNSISTAPSIKTTSFLSKS